MMKLLALFTATFVTVSVWSSGATYLSCPPSSGGVAGICSEMCSSDADCSQSEKCCSNGCGHSCAKALVIPYHDPPLKCPTSPSGSPCTSTCLVSTNCSRGELCCPMACGSTCVQGETPTPLCPVVRNQVLNTTLIGAYVPSCEADGSFSPTQCHSSTGYCWCVDPLSGVPNSGMVRFQKPQCTSLTFFSCPAPQTDMVGTCDEQCDAATGCQSGQKCCSNGCGHACTSSLLRIPYIAPQQGAQTPLCEGVRQQATSKGLLGAFVPQCDAAGNFMTLQCHESSCWCVNPENGQPISDMASGPAIGTLSCSGCNYNGTRYSHGTNFTASDGHGSCTCSAGEVICSVTMNVLTFFSCPAPQTDMVGTCDEQCDAATGCQSGQKCCSNGCGHACTSSLLRIPYIAPQQGAQTPLCEGVRQQATSKGLLGAFVPQCDAAGNFTTMQCHESSCWCVNPENGQPTSDMASGPAIGTLPCSVCYHNGTVHASGDKFSFDLCGGYCICMQDKRVTCTSVQCNTEEERIGEESDWWHTALVVCAVIAAILSLVAMALLTVVVGVVRRHNQYRHMKVPTAEEFTTFTKNLSSDDEDSPKSKEVRT